MAFILSRLPSLASALRTGELSSAEYLKHLEARFAEYEAAILAFVPEEGRFERLRREAEALAERYPQPGSRPALFGVPVGVKDIFHVSGFVTRAGSRVPPEVLQGTEAECITQLKAAGALILGKTVTTEFAYFGPGPTRNPLSPGGTTHTPGGSSSGSAAAVAAGLSPVALGTQTIGSILRPASFCGIVGFKPTYDRISRAGVIPLSPSLDHIGVFASDVAGAALAASLLWTDSKPERHAGGSRPDVHEGSIEQVGLSERAAGAPQHVGAATVGAETAMPGRGADSQRAGRPTLGVPQGAYLVQAGQAMRTHFDATCRRLAEAGYEVKSVKAMPDFEAVRERHNLIVAAEAARVHKDWYPRFRDLYHLKTVELLERGRTISDEVLAEALAGRERLRTEMTSLMEAHGLDLWAAPSAPGPAPEGLTSTGDPVMNLPWTHAGLPAVSVPSGRDAAGLPLGLQLVGRWYGDEALLAYASEVEAVLTAGEGDRGQ